MSTKGQAPVAPTTAATTSSDPPPTVKANRSISLNLNYLKFYCQYWLLLNYYYH